MTIKIITLMGADASGKDTQLAVLKKHLEAQHKKVQVITIWDSLSEFSAVNDKKSLQQIVGTFLLKYEAHARSFFLMACLKNSVSKIDSTCDYVLLNGFFQKYWASEMSYGVESALWEQNHSQFPVSDKIIYLKTPVEVCMARKTSWSDYEQGHGLFVDQKKYLSREEFQKELHSHLDDISKKYKNCVVIDGSQTEAQVSVDLIKEL